MFSLVFSDALVSKGCLKETVKSVQSNLNMFYVY